jgi:Flp pilus assembly pilin Flp
MHSSNLKKPGSESREPSNPVRQNNRLPTTVTVTCGYLRTTAPLGSRVSPLKDNLPLVFLESREQTGLTHQKGEGMNIQTFRNLWSNEEGQDIAEYAVMLAVILVLVVGTIRLIGGSSNNVFSSVASSIGQ